MIEALDSRLVFYLILMPAARVPCIAFLALATFRVATALHRTDTTALRAGHLLALGALQERRLLLWYWVELGNETCKLFCVRAGIVATCREETESQGHGSVCAACLATATAVVLDTSGTSQVGVVPG